MMMAPVAPHVPVLLAPLLRAVAPVAGVWLDGTFGAGGYARGAARRRRGAGDRRRPRPRGAGARRGLGRRTSATGWTLRRRDASARSTAIAAEAGAPALDGVVLDIGVSSMQLDQAERGFSFQKDGPLDMRMSQAGPTRGRPRQPAARGGARRHPLPATARSAPSRRIARAIVADRGAARRSRRRCSSPA